MCYCLSAIAGGCLHIERFLGLFIQLHSLLFCCSIILQVAVLLNRYLVISNLLFLQTVLRRTTLSLAFHIGRRVPVDKLLDVKLLDQRMWAFVIWEAHQIALHEDCTN